MAIKTLAEYHTHLSREQAIVVLDMMYDFAKLAVNQQLRILSDNNSKLIRVLDQDKNRTIKNN